jgi:hypothetical protein
LIGKQRSKVFVSQTNEHPLIPTTETNAGHLSAVGIGFPHTPRPMEEMQSPKKTATRNQELPGSREACQYPQRSPKKANPITPPTPLFKTPHNPTIGNDSEKKSKKSLDENKNFSESAIALSPPSWGWTAQVMDWQPGACRVPHHRGDEPP